MTITLGEGVWGLILLGVFIPHWGLPYAQRPNSKVIYQLNRFPREKYAMMYILYTPYFYRVQVLWVFQKTGWSRSPPTLFDFE
jgi:hypothetical protein